MNNNELDQLTQPQPTNLSYALGRSVMTTVPSEEHPQGEKMQFVMLSLQMVTGTTVVFLPPEFAIELAKRLIEQAELPDPTVKLTIAKDMPDPSKIAAFDQLNSKLRDGRS